MLGCGNQNMVQNSTWFLGKKEGKKEKKRRKLLWRIVVSNEARLNGSGFLAG